MTQIKRTTIKPEDTAIVVQELRATLVELIDLTLQAKQAHWNVVGPRFRALHLQLDDLVALTRDYSDTVAERIVTLGEPATGLAAQVAHGSKLDPLPTDALRDDDVVKLMIDRLSELSAHMRERIGLTEKRDPVSADIFITQLGKLEEQLWMFHAQAL